MPPSEVWAARDRQGNRAEGRRVPVKVLDFETELEGDDGYELFLRGEAEGPFRYPVATVRMRVGIAEPVGRCEPTPEAVDRAAELLLGVKRAPWWRRWWDSEMEKKKGLRWRVSS